MHGRLARATMCALSLLLVLAAPGFAQSDAFESATPLYLGAPVTADNGGATVQPGESLTASAAPGLTHCVDGTTASQASGTLWWVVGGTGRPITITTAGSALDTHLGVFTGPLAAGALCQDADGAGESITFPSAAGTPYRIQVGACAVNTPGGCGASAGAIRLLATSPPPPNDLRGAAAALPAGTVVAGDNHASGEEPGETLACASQPYGRTVWYRFTAPSHGSLQVVVTGADPAVAVYPQTGARLGCDATPGGDARLTVGEVAKGDVLLQVGGVGSHAPPATDAAQSVHSVQATFTRGSDRERVASRARLAISLFDRYTKVTSLSVRNVPAGARVQLRCSGRSCPFARTPARTIRRKRSSVSLMTAKLRAARIVPRTSLEVRVTRAGRIGSVTRFRFTRRGRSPAQQVRCLPPGARIPTRC